MTTTIELSPEIEQRLDSLVAQTGRSKDFYLCEIIERGMEDVEDYYLAHEALERLRRGEGRVYSSSEIRADLGLDR